MDGKSLNGVYMEELTGLVKSISNFTEALSLFKARICSVLIIIQTRDYMLERSRVNNCSGDMVVVFDLMQRQIICRNLTTYLIIFKGLDIKRRIRQAPISLTQMSTISSNVFE